MNIYKEALDRIENGDAVYLKTTNIAESGSVFDLHRELSDISLNLNDGFNIVKPVYDNDLYEPFFPKERLVILGGGHIALALSSYGISCGFDVVVCDDRLAFANRERFKNVSKVICNNFTDAINSLKLNEFDYVVVITRGHQNDEECLKAILSGKDVAYLGQIGSRRRTRELFKGLKEQGYDSERIDRICSPIGLNIGSVTPEEIAISIMAEIISYKRMAEVNKKPRIINGSDLDYYLIEHLANDHEPKAIVTVMETKGSTPRKAGAKMCVDKHGKIIGSIGGGCSEQAIIMDAIDIIGTNRYMISFIDMTNDVAAGEGMVCGGTMKVLIEDGSNL